jgi:chloramphenicol 3-O phosphotransferase
LNRWPDVVLLNGSSSAGKTSIARTLQSILVPSYLSLSVDDMFRWAPMRWHDSEAGFRFEPRSGGAVAFVSGPEGLAMWRAWRRMVRAAVDAGQRVIVDDVFLDPGQYDDWAEVLRGCDAVLVGVHCDLAELQRREAVRGDRELGQALWQFERAHAQGPYDFEIDTTAMSAEACARDIMARLAVREQLSVLAQRRP